MSTTVRSSVDVISKEKPYDSNNVADESFSDESTLEDEELLEIESDKESNTNLVDKSKAVNHKTSVDNNLIQDSEEKSESVKYGSEIVVPKRSELSTITSNSEEHRAGSKGHVSSSLDKHVSLSVSCMTVDDLNEELEEDEHEEEEEERDTSQMFRGGSEQFMPVFSTVDQRYFSEGSINESSVQVSPSNQNVIASDQTVISISLQKITSNLISKSQQTVQPLFNQFTVFESQVFLAILCEAHEELITMKNTLPYNTFDWSKVYESPQEFIIKVINYTAQRIFSDYNNKETSLYWQLQLKLYEFQVLIEDLLKELYHNGSFQCLIKFLQDGNLIMLEEKLLLNQNKILNIMKSNLKKELLDKEMLAKPKLTKTIFDTEEEIVYDETVIINTKCRYVTQWENARVAQNVMKINRKEGELIDALGMLTYKRDNNDRIANEWEIYLNSEIMNLENTINDLVNELRREVEERDVDITNLTGEKSFIENKLKTMIETYNEREIKIKEWQEFFAEVERQDELEYQRNKNAIIIQRWWKKYLKLKRQFIKLQKQMKKSAKKK